MVRRKELRRDWDTRVGRLNLKGQVVDCLCWRLTCINNEIGKIDKCWGSTQLSDEQVKITEKLRN